MTDTRSLLIDDIAVEIIRSARRTLSLEVGHSGVKVRAPLRMRDKSIVDFITSKQDWLRRHVANLPPPEPVFEFADDVEILFQGTLHRIKIETGQRAPVTLINDIIVVPVLQSHLRIEETAHRKLIKWMKHTAHQRLRERVMHYAPQMQIPANKKASVHVRDYRRRWGSCDHLGRLSFNWRIVLAPSEVLDYVVVHELAHCHVFNHSKRFWRLVDQQLPSRKSQQQWLDRHGAKLYRL